MLYNDMDDFEFARMVFNWEMPKRLENIMRHAQELLSNDTIDVDDIIKLNKYYEALYGGIE